MHDGDRGAMELGDRHVVAADEGHLGAELDPGLGESPQGPVHQDVAARHDRRGAGRPRQDLDRRLVAVVEREVAFEHAAPRAAAAERGLEPRPPLVRGPSRSADDQRDLAMTKLDKMLARLPHAPAVVEERARRCHARREVAVDEHERHIDRA